MHRVELTSMPKKNRDAIWYYIQGARTVLNEMTTDGDDPVEVDWEDDDGTVHIFLIYGKWVGPHKAHFPDYEHLDWQI